MYLNLLINTDNGYSSPIRRFRCNIYIISIIKILHNENRQYINMNTEDKDLVI